MKPLGAASGSRSSWCAGAALARHLRRGRRRRRQPPRRRPSDREEQPEDMGDQDSPPRVPAFGPQRLTPFHSGRRCLGLRRPQSVAPRHPSVPSPSLPARMGAACVLHSEPSRPSANVCRQVARKTTRVRLGYWNVSRPLTCPETPCRASSEPRDHGHSIEAGGPRRMS